MKSLIKKEALSIKTKTINKILARIIPVRVYFLALIFALAPLLSNAQLNSSFLTSEYIFPKQEKHLHSRSVVELHSGDFLVSWFEGSDELEFSDMIIMGARLINGQSQWSEPFLMVDTPGNPDCLLAAISVGKGDFWKASLPGVGNGNIQPPILQKNDGIIVTYMPGYGDSQQRIIVSTSEDNGYTWSVFHKTNIPNPGVSVEAITLNDGHWLMVYNDLEDGRNRLAVSLSDDEGETWKWKRYVEYEPKGKGSFSYPKAIQSQDSRVHAVYSHHTPEGKSIRHVSFLPEWVKEFNEGDTHAEKLGFPKDKKVLLLHMDDLGMCQEANDAGKYYIENDFVYSGAVMMPCADAEEFVAWANTEPKADIGVHLTLTSEWKTWRWGTLTDTGQVPGLTDPDGKMWRSVMEVVMNATAEEVEMEVRSQIDKMLAMGYNPTHIDTHMGTLYGTPEFLKVFLKVAEEYKIPANVIDVSKIVAFYKSEGYPVDEAVVSVLNNYALPRLDNFGSVPKGNTYDEVKSNFFKLVKELDPGLTEIVFHPLVETENLKSITGSWQQRVWEGEMFADSEMLRFFEENDIILTTWREVMERFNRK